MATFQLDGEFEMTLTKNAADFLKADIQVISSKSVMDPDTRLALTTLLFGGPECSLPIPVEYQGFRLAQCAMIFGASEKHFRPVAIDPIFAGNDFLQSFERGLPALNHQSVLTFLKNTRGERGEFITGLYKCSINGDAEFHLHVSSPREMLDKMTVPQMVGKPGCPLIADSNRAAEVTRQCLGELWVHPLHLGAMRFLDLSGESLLRFLTRRAIISASSTSGVKAHVTKARFIIPTLPKLHRYQEDQAKPVGDESMNAIREFVHWDESKARKQSARSTRRCWFGCEGLSCGACSQLHYVTQTIAVAGVRLQVHVQIELPGGGDPDPQKLDLVIPIPSRNGAFRVNDRVFPSSRYVTSGVNKPVSVGSDSAVGVAMDPASKGIRFSLTTQFASAMFILKRVSSGRVTASVSNLAGMTWVTSASQGVESDAAVAKEYNDLIIKRYRLRLAETVQAGEEFNDTNPFDDEEQLEDDPRFNTNERLGEENFEDVRSVIKHVVDNIAYLFVRLSARRDGDHVTDVSVMRSPTGAMKVAMQGRLAIGDWVSAFTRVIRYTMIRLGLKFSDKSSPRTTPTKSMISRLSAIWNNGVPDPFTHPGVDKTWKKKMTASWNDFTSTLGYEVTDHNRESVMEDWRESRIEKIHSMHSALFAKLASSSEGLRFIRYLIFTLVSMNVTKKQPLATTSLFIDYWKIALLWTLLWRKRSTVEDAVFYVSGFLHPTEINDDVFSEFKMIIGKLETMLGQPSAKIVDGETVSELSRSTVISLLLKNITGGSQIKRDLVRLSGIGGSAAWGVGVAYLKHIGRSLANDTCIVGAGLRAPTWDGIMLGIFRRCVNLKVLVEMLDRAGVGGGIGSGTQGSQLKQWKRDAEKLWATQINNAMSLHAVRPFAADTNRHHSFIRGASSPSSQSAMSPISWTGTYYTKLPPHIVMPIAGALTSKKPERDFNARPGIQSEVCVWTFALVAAVVADSVNDFAIPANISQSVVDRWLSDGVVIDELPFLSNSRSLTWDEFIPPSGLFAHRTFDEQLRDHVDPSLPFIVNMRAAEKWVTKVAMASGGATSLKLSDRPFLLVLNTIPICMVSAAHACFLHSAHSVSYEELVGPDELPEEKVEFGQPFKPSFVWRLGFVTSSTNVDFENRVIFVACNSSRLMQLTFPNHPGFELPDGSFVHPSIGASLDFAKARGREFDIAQVTRISWSTGFSVFNLLPIIQNRMHICTGSLCEAHMSERGRKKTTRWDLCADTGRMVIRLVSMIARRLDGEYLFGRKKTFARFVDSSSFHISSKEVISFETWQRMSKAQRIELGHCDIRVSCNTRGTGSLALLKDSPVTGLYDTDAAVKIQRSFVGTSSAKPATNGSPASLSSTDDVVDDDRFVDLPSSESSLLHTLTSMMRYGVKQAFLKTVENDSPNGLIKTVSRTGRLPSGKLPVRRLIPAVLAQTREDSHVLNGPFKLQMADASAYPVAITVSLRDAKKKVDVSSGLGWVDHRPTLESQLVIDPVSFENEPLFLLAVGTVISRQTTYIARLGSRALHTSMPDAYNFALAVIHVDRKNLLSHGVIIYYFALVSPATSFRDAQIQTSGVYEVRSEVPTSSFQRWRTMNPPSNLVDTRDVVYEIRGDLKPDGEAIGSAIRLFGNARKTTRGLVVSTWTTHFRTSFDDGREEMLADALAFRVCLPALALVVRKTGAFFPHSSSSGTALGVQGVEEKEAGIFELLIADGTESGTAVEAMLHPCVSDWHIVGFASLSTVHAAWKEARGGTKWRIDFDYEWSKPLPVEQLMFFIEHKQIRQSNPLRRQTAYILPRHHNAKLDGIVGGLKTMHTTVNNGQFPVTGDGTVVSTRPRFFVSRGTSFVSDSVMLYGPAELGKRGGYRNDMKFTISAMSSGGSMIKYPGMAGAHKQTVVPLAFSSFAQLKTFKTRGVGAIDPSNGVVSDSNTNHKGLLPTLSTNFPHQRPMMNVLVCSKCNLLGSVYTEGGVSRCATRTCQGVLPVDVKMPVSFRSAMLMGETMRISYGRPDMESGVIEHDSVIRRGATLAHEPTRDISPKLLDLILP